MTEIFFVYLFFLIACVMENNDGMLVGASAFFSNFCKILYAKIGGRDKKNDYMKRLSSDLICLYPWQAIHLVSKDYMPRVVSESCPFVRFEMLEHVYGETRYLIERLEKSAGGGVLPLFGEARASALVADNFLKALASAYQGIVTDIMSQEYSLRGENLLSESAHRAMCVLLKRHMLAYGASARPSSSSWRRMHELYFLTRSRSQVKMGEGSIEHTYCTALLLGYANRNKLPRESFSTLKNLVDSLVTSVRIVDTTEFQRNKPSKFAARFIVLVDEGCPGKPLAEVYESISNDRALIVECSAAVFSIDRKLNQMQVAGSEYGADKRMLENLLISLRNSLGGGEGRLSILNQSVPPSIFKVGSLEDGFEKCMA